MFAHAPQAEKSEGGCPDKKGLSPPVQDFTARREFALPGASLDAATGAQDEQE
jgi:hypothetical protein